MAKVAQSMNRRKLNDSLLNQGITNELWNHEDIKIMQEVYTSKFYKEW